MLSLGENLEPPPLDLGALTGSHGVIAKPILFTQCFRDTSISLESCDTFDTRQTVRSTFGPYLSRQSYHDTALGLSSENFGTKF